MNGPKSVFGYPTQDLAIRVSVENLLRDHGPMTVVEIEVALDLTRTKVETALRHLRTVKPVIKKLRVHHEYRPLT